MGVALRALHGQAQDRRADDGFGVFQRLVVVAGRVLDADEVRAAGIRGTSQEAGRDEGIDDVRGQFLRVAVVAPVVAELVAGDLFAQEAIVRHVGVQGPDDPVAVTPGGGSHVIRVEDTFAIGIPGHVQPVPAPAFAVARGRQLAIDHLLVSIRRSIREKGILFRRRRRKAREIDRDPP